MNLIEDLVHRHRSGETTGIYSVCSAHPTVLRAAMHQSLADQSVLLIEATSNQVDQFGGYTGMKPADFRNFVQTLAAQEGFDLDRLVLGGDHLGPNRWRSDDPQLAMQNAEDLVGAYAAAGYTKLHLDCSMPLRGDRTPVDDTLVAERTTRLLQVAERVVTDRPGSTPPVYVIGTEVPVPGGARETLHALTPTGAQAARDTLRAHQVAFADAGLTHVWPRVAALVVQPGVEFDHLNVIDYDPTATGDLQSVLDSEPNLVFEAHSTDYQIRRHLAALVEDHWAILKVGPALTFALREALFALAAIESHLVPEVECSNLIDVVEQRMLQNPSHWNSYYHGTPDQQRLARRFSYSDRIRYYWTDPQIVAAEARLYRNLSERAIPEPLLSQYLPRQFTRARNGSLTPAPPALVLDAVRDVLRDYSAACRLHRPPNILA